ALTDAEKSHMSPQEVESVNLEGTKKVADACLRQKIKLFFPSTTSVYSSQASRVDETSRELETQSPYAKSKLMAEQYLWDLKSQGLRYVICRFGTIFGPSIGMRFHTAVNKFIWQAILGKPITVWKTAWEQKRPYLDLTDCVAAINFILEKDLFDGEIFNILTVNLTVQDIVETIKQFVPELKVDFVESPIMNQLSYEVDDSKFKRLGFESVGNLEKGVSDSIELLERIKANAN
ncbi:MAG: SDR family oxidoreductase, partial [Candidatus Doudnabacteria bacterium]|nr:SDR family oxidoreductase [Candidatus Doudnabacteria bacterium]